MLHPSTGWTSNTHTRPYPQTGPAPTRLLQGSSSTSQLMRHNVFATSPGNPLIAKPVTGGPYRASGHQRSISMPASKQPSNVITNGSTQHKLTSHASAGARVHVKQPLPREARGRKPVAALPALWAVKRPIDGVARKVGEGYTKVGSGPPLRVNAGLEKVSAAVLVYSPPRHQTKQASTAREAPPAGRIPPDRRRFREIGPVVLNYIDHTEERRLRGSTSGRLDISSSLSPRNGDLSPSQRNNQLSPIRKPPVPNARGKPSPYAEQFLKARLTSPNRSPVRRAVPSSVKRQSALRQKAVNDKKSDRVKKQAEEAQKKKEAEEAKRKQEEEERRELERKAEEEAAEKARVQAEEEAARKKKEEEEKRKKSTTAAEQPSMSATMKLDPSETDVVMTMAKKPAYYKGELYVVGKMDEPFAGEANQKRLEVWVDVPVLSKGFIGTKQIECEVFSYTDCPADVKEKKPGNGWFELIGFDKMGKVIKKIELFRNDVNSKATKKKTKTVKADDALKACRSFALSSKSEGEFKNVVTSAQIRVLYQVDKDQWKAQKELLDKTKNMREMVIKGSVEMPYKGDKDKHTAAALVVPPEEKDGWLGIKHISTQITSRGVPTAPGSRGSTWVELLIEDENGEAKNLPLVVGNNVGNSWVTRTRTFSLADSEFDFASIVPGWKIGLVARSSNPFAAHCAVREAAVELVYYTTKDPSPEIVHAALGKKTLHTSSSSRLSVGTGRPGSPSTLAPRPHSPSLSRMESAVTANDDDDDSEELSRLDSLPPRPSSPSSYLTDHLPAETKQDTEPKQPKYSPNLDRITSNAVGEALEAGPQAEDGKNEPKVAAEPLPPVAEAPKEASKEDLKTEPATAAAPQKEPSKEESAPAESAAASPATAEPPAASA